MTTLEILERARVAAEAEAKGDPAAHVILLREIHQLQLAAETPAEKTMRLRFQMLQNLCVRLAIEFNVLQTIAAKADKPVTAAELSKETGVDELLIIRIMRLITYVGLCEEVGYATYAGNESTKAVTTKGLIGGEIHHTDLTFGVGAKLVEMVRTQGMHQFPKGDQKSPFQYAYGGMGMFELLEQDPEQKEAFDHYMSARRSADVPQWFDLYPVEERLGGKTRQGDSALIVDIGGGKGHELAGFRQRFPQVKGKLVLQDLPVTLRSLDPKPEGIEAMEHDFFTEQPVKGAHIYYMRAIMHDWPDDKCQVILSKIREAMDPEHSRILIDDYVLPDTGCDVRGASMDILMMMFVSALERTRHQWEDLLQSVGLEIAGVWSAVNAEESVIEARVRW